MEHIKFIMILVMLMSAITGINAESIESSKRVTAVVGKHNSSHQQEGSNPSHSVNILSEDARGIHVKLDLNHYYTNKVRIGDTDYLQVSLDQEGVSCQKGMPELPYVTKSFHILPGRRVVVKILKSEYEEIKADVIPSKGIVFRNQDPKSIPYVFGEFYNSDTSFPKALAELSETFILRDLTGITLYVNPFVYQPSRGITRVYHTIELVLEYTDALEDMGSSLINPNSGKVEEGASPNCDVNNALTGEFVGIYEDMFINFKKDRYTQVNEQGSLLVIAHNSFINTIQTYVNWKKQKGINTTLVNMNSIGTTADQLKTYIQNFYNQNPALVYVQLVGDAAHIPTASYSWGSSSGASDPTLALLAGSDQYPDIFIGRFSCESTTDLETQITRTIRYERDMAMSDTWLQTATGIASNEGGSGGQGDNGESDEQHMQIVRNNLLNYGYTSIDQFYENSGVTAAQVTSALNSGRGYLNYVGHGLTDRWGTTSYNNNNVLALNNQNKLPFIVSVACLNGNFVGVTCFAEAWMRARVANNPTGAVVFYGSSISQPWNPPMRAQDEISRLITNDLKNTVGGLFYNGSCRMIEVYGTTNGGVATFRTWHIFGDVSMQVRTKTPQAMTVSYNQSVPLGATSFSVNTGTAGALVSLSYENVIYGRGVANSSGLATFLITTPAALVQMTLTVTAFNRLTHIGSVQVVPSNQAFLLVDQFIYLDGNNQTAEVGETGSFDIVVKNIGNVQASNITLDITSTYPGVSFIQTSTSFPDLSALSQITISNAFSFTLPTVASNQDLLPFVVNIQATQGSWSSFGNLVINAPSFTFTGLSINDATGNNNSRLDPGESVVITQNVMNNGSYSAPAGILTLNSSSQYLTITSTGAQIPSLQVGQSISLSFNLVVSENTPPASIQNLFFSLNAGGYTHSHSAPLTVGLIIEDFESGSFSRFPWLFSGSNSWQISSATSYDGVFSARSGAISHNQTSVMQLSLSVLEAGNISFWRKVSSDLYYDKLNFYIDNTLMGSWHGDANWYQFSYPVSTGLHVFKWEYSKDVAISTGLDCGWIDDIIFPRSVPVENYNPPRNLVSIQEGSEAVLSWQPPITGIPTGYQVYRNNLQVALLAGSILNYRDGSVSIGNTFQYKLKAVFNGGTSVFSNQTTITMATPAQLETDRQQILKAVHGDLTAVLPLRLSNLGAMNLVWNASIEERVRPGESTNPSMGKDSNKDLVLNDRVGLRDMTGSWMSCEPASFTPGNLNSHTIRVKNMSSDGEYISHASLILPLGFEPQSVTAFTGGSSGTLLYSGFNSVTREMTWATDDPQGWGVVTPGEIAVAIVSIYVQPNVSGNQLYTYSITGDGFGAPPQVVSGTLELENNSGFWLNLNESNGTIPGGGNTEIQLLINSHFAEDGLYEYDLLISSNDHTIPVKIIPIKLRIYRDLDWFMVSSLMIDETPQGFHLSWEPLWEADAYHIEYSEDNSRFQLLGTTTEAFIQVDHPPHSTGFFRVKAYMEE